MARCVPYALIALLQQPIEDLPYLIVVDEPELGLHPQALELVASLFQAVTTVRFSGLRLIVNGYRKVRYKHVRVVAT